MLGGRFGDVVDVVVAVGVGEFLRGFVCNFGEDEGSEGGGLRGSRGGALGEDGTVVCYARTGEFNMLVSCVLVFRSRGQRVGYCLTRAMAYSELMKTPLCRIKTIIYGVQLVDCCC